MYTTAVYLQESEEEGGTEGIGDDLLVAGDKRLLVAVGVSNAYDVSQWLAGKMDRNGGTEKDLFVKFPMTLWYTNARNKR
jgi:hypothetical protein